ncbi:MAG: ParB/RepB/Spo0J family partition protein [bacterium]|nr:ParB/RepB/Spo0J family partition protein [bacterium]
MKNSADDIFVHGNIYHIKCSSLQPNNNQPRKFKCPEAMEALEESIRLLGQIHTITFTRIDNLLRIVSGERRWLAFQKAGIEYIQARYIDRDLEAIALAENFQREDLLPMEKAELILSLKKQHGLTLAQIAKYIGKSVPSVSELISLNRLPEDVKVACRNSNIYVLTRLVKIAKASGQKSQRQLFKAYQQEISGEKYRGELRRDYNDISKLIAQLDRIVTDILKVKTEHMAENIVINLFSKFNIVEQTMTKKAYEYRA